eukprot:3908188-Prymnesium_polylepis.1
MARTQSSNIGNKATKALLQTRITNHAILGLHGQGHKDKQTIQPFRMEKDRETTAYEILWCESRGGGRH